MSSILDACAEYEWSRRIAWREMTSADRRQALIWLAKKMTEESGVPLEMPDDMFPQAGISVISEDLELLCVMGVYFDGAVCVPGWCVTNPDNTPRDSHRAVEEAVDHIEYFASRRKARHIITMFGSRGINKILSRKGYAVGDSCAVSQYRRVV